MAPSPSPDALLAEPEAELLLDLAESALGVALFGRDPGLPALSTLRPMLHEPRGAFVTLTVDGELNGCIGDIEGREPLARAVVRLALAAAFDDPRLPPLEPGDWSRLTIEISLLSRLVPVPARSREELLALVRPGIDGLVVREQGRQGLFLPSVWGQLPHPDDFVDQLWRKAGLPPSAWSLSTQVFTFTTQRHHRAVGAPRQESHATEPN